MERDLIFDIGLHTGEDAAYYLSLGYRVVGVEANPILAEECARRFDPEIRDGRMKIVNAGVLSEPGEFTFYRNLTDSAWSSFKPEMGKNGGRWEELMVSCVTTRQLTSEHGLPFFMKVDIEGADVHALQSLTLETAPPYISLELNFSDPILERLIELGYSAFKFVNGETGYATAPILNHELGWRILRKAGRIAPPIRSAMRKLPPRWRPRSEWDPPGKYGSDGYSFSVCSSGPFGEQAPGQWKTKEVAIKWLNRLREGYLRAGAAAFWWDVHARHSLINQTLASNSGLRFAHARMSSRSHSA
ncbi:MAG TPA: FkbM family methyltransferase [Bryobacteraceae bacterium]|jgi:FkbM family methyltransferase